MPCAANASFSSMTSICSILMPVSARTFCVAGAALWVGSLCLAGYFFGNIPAVKSNLTVVIEAGSVTNGTLIDNGDNTYTFTPTAAAFTSSK